MAKTFRLLTDNDGVMVEPQEFTPEQQHQARKNIGANIVIPNKPLSALKQTFFRNLEGDNLLPTAEFSGRTRPIETAMYMVGKIQEEGKAVQYIVSNVPYIKDLIDNPTNWLIFADTTGSDYLETAGWLEYTFTAVKILTAEYIGIYEGNTNCCRFTTNLPIPYKLTTTLGIGDKMFILSFKAYGTNIRQNVAFPTNPDANAWNRDHTHSSFIYKHSDGSFRALVTGNNTSRPQLTAKTAKLMKASDPMTDTWELVFNNSTDDIVGILPSPYTGFSEISGIFKKVGSDAMYISAIGLFETPRIVNKLALFEFNEDFTYKRIILADTSGYTFAIGMNQLGYGISYVNYKGKHLISVVDGTHNTGKRVILQSDRLEGQYSLHSTVYDWSEPWMKQSGSVFTNSIANANLFVYNCELYHFTSGEAAESKTGIAAKHQLFLWKYDDAKNKWLPVILPVLMSLHGNRNNYPGMTDAGVAHLGATYPCFVDGEKLWMVIQLRDFVGYKSTVGYWDLNEALK